MLARQSMRPIGPCYLAQLCLPRTFAESNGLRCEDLAELCEGRECGLERGLRNPKGRGSRRLEKHHASSETFEYDPSPLVDIGPARVSLVGICRSQVVRWLQIDGRTSLLVMLVNRRTIR